MSQQINLTPGGPFAVRGAVEKCVSSGGEGLPPHLTGRVTVVPGGGALAIACNSFWCQVSPGLSGEQIPQGLGPSSLSLKLIYDE